MDKYRGEITKLYIALMFTLVPLVYDDNYNGILDVKTHNIIVISIGLMICMIPVCIFYIYQNGVKKCIDSILSQISCVDLFIIAFTVVALISTILSSDVSASFSGMAAWRVGSKMILICTVIYFIISRTFNTKKMDIWVFLYFGGGAVIVFSFLDRLGIDVMGMFVSVLWEYDIFTSTIGNVDFYATFVSLILPIFMIFPLNTSKKYVKLSVYALIYIGFVNMYIILANAIFLGVGAAMLFVVYYSLLDYRRLKNLGIIGVLFSLAGYTTRVIDVKWPFRSVDRDAVVAMILRYKLDYVIGIISIALLIALMIVNKLPKERKEYVDRLCNKFLSRIYLGIVVVAVLVVIVAIALHPTLEMGNYRGYIWYMCFKGFAEGGLKNKFLGAGPGLIDSVIQPQIQKSTLSLVRDYWYRTAHSEIVEFITTMGIIGALSYLGILVSVFVKQGKIVRDKTSIKSAMVFAGIVGYIVQALVMGPYALNYALFYVMLGIWSAYTRERNAE